MSTYGCSCSATVLHRDRVCAAMACVGDAFELEMRQQLAIRPRQGEWVAMCANDVWCHFRGGNARTCMAEVMLRQAF